jgi:hypothetical protein
MIVTRAVAADYPVPPDSPVRARFFRGPAVIGRATNRSSLRVRDREARPEGRGQCPPHRGGAEHLDQTVDEAREAVRRAN